MSPAALLSLLECQLLSLLESSPSIGPRRGARHRRMRQKQYMSVRLHRGCQHLPAALLSLLRATCQQTVIRRVIRIGLHRGAQHRR